MEDLDSKSLYHNSVDLNNRQILTQVSKLGLRIKMAGKWICYLDPFLPNSTTGMFLNICFSKNLACLDESNFEVILKKFVPQIIKSSLL